MSGRPGARQVPDWPGKITPSPEARTIFQSPEFFQNMTNFLIFMGIFMNFDKIYESKKRKFRQKLGFMMQNHNLRPIFATARKNIFGKVVTLGCPNI